MAPRILSIDIETSPIEAYTWGLWQQNVGINQIKKPTTMLSFAAKWVGKPKRIFHSVFHDGEDQMVQAAWDLLDQADAIMTWNGKSFDEPHLNREFIEHGLTPPSPFKHIDLMQTAKRQFRFPSNKLDYVARALGCGGKVSTGGFELWLACMAGDEKAWAKMRRYNIQDVVLLEELHDKMLPYIKNYPHVGLYSPGEEDCCGKCGSQDLERRGQAYTPLGAYQQYRCRPCGSWSRGKKALATVDVRTVSSR